MVGPEKPSAIYDVDQSVFEDEDASVCGVVYITSEGGVHQPKSSQSTKKLLPLEPYARAHAEKKLTRRKMLILSLTGMLLVLGIVIGIAIGECSSSLQQYSCIAPVHSHLLVLNRPHGRPGLQHKAHIRTQCTLTSSSISMRRVIDGLTADHVKCTWQRNSQRLLVTLSYLPAYGV